MGYSYQEKYNPPVQNIVPEKRLITKVFVFEASNDKEIRVFHADLAKDHRVQWLKNLILWAVQNNKYVEVINANDG